MNQCDDRIKELIPLYPDNELTLEEKVIVDEHVATCSECMEELQLYMEIHDEIALDSIEAPKGFHNDLVSKLELLAKKSKPSLYTRYNKYINVAAMLVFVIFLSVLGLTQGNKWGQTSDESIMSKSEMATETTTEETRVETKEEAKAEMKSEAKMDMAVEEVVEEVKEEETMEMVMEASDEESADAKTASNETSEDSAVAFDDNANTEIEVAAEDTRIYEDKENTSEIIIAEENTESKEAFGTAADDTTYTLLEESEEIDDSSDINLAFSEEVTTNESKELIAEEESNQTIVTSNPIEEPETNVFIYIFITIVSLVVGVSVFYFIRKRILKN